MTPLLFKRRMSAKKIDFAIGGQALVEGVMMRAPHGYALAVRAPSGKILVKTVPFVSVSERLKILKLPVLRGIIGFFEMMVVGIKALNYSVSVSIGDEKKSATSVSENFFIGIALIFSLAFGIFLFKFLPLTIAQFLSGVFPVLARNYFLFNIIDGVIKILFFSVYIGLIGLLPDIARVFQYHGAEHKTVFAYERGVALNVKHAKAESRFHPRCGTSFILVVFLLSILLYTLLPNNPDFWVKFVQRIAVLPIIAGFSYEILKFSARHRESFFARIISYPGLLLQRFTTREPDEKQLEVALKALESALAMEKE
ncbi:DUF1385 domain-containing protein [Candidatus Peregrinibacteria bacterium]|nr:DUF1385 domain-containing protein [Candidatus Peregrinibacteria bacterium]